MRESNSCLGALGEVVLGCLAVFGVVCLIAGISQQVKYDHTYQIKFSVAGQRCDPGPVTFSRTDGSVLDCTFKGITPLGPVQADFPGFSKAQDASVTAFAGQLGQNGISVDDMRRIQERVDRIADTLPADRRPNYRDGIRFGPLWAKNLAWAGGGLVLGVLLVAASIRLVHVRRGTRTGRSG